MQPKRATRGIAAVALSSAGMGLLLLALALVLSACTSSGTGPAGGSSAASAGSSGPAASSRPSATSPTGSTAPTTSPTIGPSTNPAPTGGPTTGASSGAPGPDDTVPAVPVTTAPAVPLTAAAPAAGGGSITIGAITSIQGTARLPGEVAGPAVQVPVTFVNGTGAAVNLAQVVVDLVDSAGVSAGQLSASPAAPFSGTLAPGATARATYVFTLATDDRRGIRIVVSYTTAAPVVVFTGNIA